MTREIIDIGIIPMKKIHLAKNIDMYGYRENTKTLRIKFFSGKHYDYIGVSREDWEKLKSRRGYAQDNILLKIISEHQGVKAEVQP